MKTSVEIQNFTCGGCDTWITNKCNALNNVDNDLVAIEISAVSFKYTTEAVFEQVKKTLARLGYPLAYD
ncbi:MAG: copper chaperone CopZ [Maribacter sp.]|jgi:copper chaperone CopZ|tara:strand:- start:219 stop:425 length:207 start_codon:yes stop_codon:yes gene_type:complete